MKKTKESADKIKESADTHFGMTNMRTKEESIQQSCFSDRSQVTLPIMSNFIAYQKMIQEQMMHENKIHDKHFPALITSTRVPKVNGERHCEIFCEGAESSMMMHFQVADIHRPLLSLSRAADQGFRSYLDWYGGYLEDTKTGECIPIQRRGNLYVMQIWVRGSLDTPPDASGFVRRG